MQYMNTESQSFCLEDLYTLSTCDHHYLLSKDNDVCVEF